MVREYWDCPGIPDYPSNRDSPDYLSNWETPDWDWSPAPRVRTVAGWWECWEMPEYPVPARSQAAAQGLNP